MREPTNTIHDAVRGLNQAMLHQAGTKEARTLEEWNQAGRSVRKGSKAIRVLRPEVKAAKTREGKEIKITSSYRVTAVFRKEDTVEGRAKTKAE